MWKTKKGVWSKCCFGLLAVLLCVLTLYPRAVYADPAGDDGGEVETVGGLYDATTALTAYINDVVGANSNDKHNDQRVENPGSAGNAGAYVGYGDEDQDFVPFITMNTSIGSSSSTYDAWQDVFKGNHKDAAYEYVRLGRTLADAGLDETVSGGGSMTFTRGFGGILSIIVYVASQIVPFIFGLVLTLLQKLNVFQLFANVTVMTNDYWQDAYGTPMPVLGPLVDFVSGLYNHLSEAISWAVVVPLLFAFTAATVLLFRSQKPGQAVGNLVKRVVFIAVGVPICAGLYTSALNALQDSMTDGSQMPTARVVSATFVDFESWAAENRLNISSSYGIESTMEDAPNEGGLASNDFLRKVRDTSTRINKDVNSDMPDAGLREESGNIADELWDDNGQVYGTGRGDSESAQTAILNLLFRYLSNDTYSSSAWATQVASEFPKNSATMGSSANDDRTDTVRAMFGATDEKDDWMKREESDNAVIWTGGSATDLEWANKDFNIFNDGTLQNTGNHDSMTWSGNLSRASLYNYLATSFTESSVVTYSSSTSVSEHTQYAHSSVTSVGSGLLKILFLLNLWVCLGVLGLVGCYFAISTGLNTLKTSFRLLTSVPLALLGVLKSIVQVLTYVVLMIGQLFMGAFLYSFMSDVLVVFATMLENFATGVTEGTTTTVLGGHLISLLYQVLPETLYDSRIGVMLMVGIELGLVVFAGSMIWTYRRVLCRVYETVWYYALKLGTASAYQESFEEIWANRRVKVPAERPEGCPVAEVFAFLLPDRKKKEVWA